MKRLLLIFSALLVLTTALYADDIAPTTAATVKVLPRTWGPHAGSHAVVKAEIRVTDPKAINTSSITMNGIAPIRTRVTDKKVMAFFSKKDVLTTFGTVTKGQTVGVSVVFSAASGPSGTFSDNIRIGGKGGNGKGNTKQKQNGKSGNHPQPPSH